MKKNLLLSSNSRTFLQIFGPLIPKLAEEFDIVIFLTILRNIIFPQSLITMCSSWEKEGIIKQYIIAPDPRDMFEFHSFMKEKIQKLRAYDFDMWIARSEIQVDDKYILECILPKHCIRIAIWPLLTYLLQREQRLAISLLSGGEMEKYLPNIENQIADSGYSLKNKLKSIETFSDLLKKTILFFINRLGLLKNYIKRIIRMIRNFIDRSIIPFLMVGKRFDYGPYDKMTQLGSGQRMDAYIFSDEIEVEVHRRLFGTSNVHFAKYPSISNCSCKSFETKKTTILTPLSMFVGMDKIQVQMLQVYYRDLNNALDHSNANKIDLRPHPDETGKWPYQLQDYLTNRGIDVRVVPPELPIGDIVCEYVGVIGDASASLRDCRASCENAFIVGLVGTSKGFFPSPEFVFGKSEGIGWVSDDGSFNPTIFKNHQYVPTAKKSIVDIVMKFSQN